MTPGWLAWVRRLFALAMLGILAWVVVGSWGDGLAVASDLGARFVLASILGLAGLTCAGASWSTLIGVPIRRGVSALGSTMPLRHLPLGGLGQMVGLSGLSIATGTQRTRAITATPAFLLATAAGATAVGVPVIWKESAPAWVRVIVLIAALVTLLTLWKGFWLSRLAPANWRIGDSIDISKIRVSFVWSTLAMAAAAGAFATLFPFTDGLVGRMSGFAASWLCGFLFVIAPAGLGVREGVLVALWPTIDSATVVTISITHRMSTLVAEIVLFALAWLWSRPREAASRTEVRP